MPFRDWALPVVWMGVILVFSSSIGSAQETSRLLVPALRWLLPQAPPLQIDALHALIRKAAHFTEYAILAALWFRALRHGRACSARAAGWAALGISLVWAAADEAHQSLLATRTGRVADVGLDAVGALTAVTIGWRGWPVARAATTVLLWTAVLGGGFVLLVDASLGISSGLLWIAVPAAVLALVVWRRGAGRPHRSDRASSPP